MTEIYDISKFPRDDSERKAQDVISKLDFISQVKCGEKIDIQSLQVVDANWWGSKAYRTFVARGESRDATLDFIKTVLHEAYETSLTYLSRESDYFNQIGVIILQAVMDCKKGLANLGKTYEDDRMFTAKMSTLAKTIDAKHTDYIKKFPSLKERLNFTEKRRR